MCGIAGISTAAVKESHFWDIHIAQFNSAISHRGYNDQGVLLVRRNALPIPVNVSGMEYRERLDYIPNQTVEENLNSEINGFLLHRRLTIIGLGERGHQPMCDESGRYWITFNGEIFNYIELKKQYRLVTVTDTDTEVLLALWAKMEDRCLPLLDGFFAFCVYDSHENTFTVARDRTGVKPIYYVVNNDGFAFASEEHVLKQYLGENTINKQALYLHVRFGMSDAVPWNESIQSVLPGHWIKWIPNLRNLIVRKWFTPTLQRLQNSRDLRELLLESMRKRLRSDVPMGFAVSGGIDSAIIVGIARWLLGDAAPLHLFGVSSSGLAGDESSWQQLVHHKVGGTFHKIQVEDFQAGDLEKIIHHTHRAPVAWNNIAHFALCERVRQEGITVIFNGQGADEIFGGYPDYFIQALVNEKKTLGLFKDNWPIPYQTAQVYSMKRRIRAKLSQSIKHRLELAVWKKAFSKDIILANTIEINPYFNEVQDEMMADYYGPLIDPKYYGRLQQMLAWEDRNGMAYQLESRNPFADDLLLPNYFLGKYTLTELSQNGYPKGMLRNAFKDFIPHELYRRTDKKGFSVPEEWLIKKFGATWFDAVMNTQLDPFVHRAYREKMVSQFDQLKLADLRIFFRLASLGMFLKQQSNA